MSFNWRFELLTLTTLAMETAWTYAWLRLTSKVLAAPAEQYLRLGSIFLLMFLATYAGRLLAPDADDADDKDSRRPYIAMAAIMAGGVLLAVHGGFFGRYALWNPAWLGALLGAAAGGNFAIIVAVLASLVLWARGMEHAQGHFDIEATGFRFRLGVVAFIWLLLVEAFYPGESLVTLLFGFFASALLAMALARVEEVSLLRGEGASPFNPSWFAIVVGATVAAMLLAGSAAQILSLPVVLRVLELLGPVFGVLEKVFVWVFFWIFYLLAMLLEPLLRVLGNWLATALGTQPFQLPGLAPPFQLQSGPDAGSNPDLVRIFTLLRWVVTGGLILLVAFFVAIGLMRRRRRSRADVPELHESIWSAQAFAEDLAALLARARRRLGDLADIRGRLRRAYATATIRQIYASLCRWAAEQGIPRPLPETPYEYLPDLAAALPGREADLRLITEAYVRVHYGEVPATREEMDAVRGAWERVQRTAGREREA